MRQSPVYYVTRTLPAYRVAALQRLDERIGGRLVVCHGSVPGGSSLGSIAATGESDLTTARVRNHWFSGERLHFQNPLPAFRRFGRPSAILAEESPRSVSLPMLIAGARLTGTPLALWGHFSSNDRPFSLSNWEDRIRIALARRADACVGYTESIAELLRPYIDADRIFVARNTLDTDTLFALHDELVHEGHAAVRERLGLPADAAVLAFLGRLLETKGTGALLDAAERLKDRMPLAMVVIGDGPERPAMERRVRDRRIPNVVFTGSLPAFADSAPYLFASDVMVMPGYVGLAVNHAFSLGLPVVTYASPGDMRYHSPEIGYVEHGVNGRIAEHGNLDALVDAVERVIRERQMYSENALQYAKDNLTIDRMVDGLESAINYLESRGRKSQ